MKNDSAYIGTPDFMQINHANIWIKVTKYDLDNLFLRKPVTLNIDILNFLGTWAVRTFTDLEL